MATSIALLTTTTTSISFKSKTNHHPLSSPSRRHSLSLPSPSPSPSLSLSPSSLPLSLHRFRPPLRHLTLTTSASATPSPIPSNHPSPLPTSSAVVAPPWNGAAIKPLLASFAIGLALWFVPVPSGVTKPAWQLLSIFLATIVGIITQPLPLGAVALMGLGASVLTKTLTFAAAFSAFGDPIPWLIALAFFFARGFIKTGLGNRIAYQFVSLFGSSSLGLGYSLVFS